MQILSDAPLFSSANFENGSFQPLPLGDINAGNNDMRHVPIGAGKNGTRPRHQPAFAALGQPKAFIFIRQHAVSQLFQNGPEALNFLGNHEQVPDLLSLDLIETIPGDLFAGTVETNDAAFAVKNRHQRPHGIEDRGDYVSLLFESPLSFLKLRDVEA